jgi:hypothetical protein
VGKMGAMLRKVAMAGHATVGDMRRLLWTAIRAALVIAVLAVVREVLLDRAPRRALHGSEPVIGSLDTWPAVPRKPGA